MAQVLALIYATSKPGTMRSKSGIPVAPERRISSGEMTKIAAATSDRFCSFFDTDVTSTFIKFSMLSCVRSVSLPCGDCPQGAWQHKSERSAGKRLLNQLGNARTEAHLPVCTVSPV